MAHIMTKEEFKSLLEKGGLALSKEDKSGFIYTKRITLPLDDERLFILLVHLDMDDNPSIAILGLNKISTSCPFRVADYEDIVWLLNHAAPINHEIITEP